MCAGERGRGPGHRWRVGHRWAEGTRSWGHSGGFGGRKCRRLVCLYLFSLWRIVRGQIESERGRGVDSLQKRRKCEIVASRRGKRSFSKKWQ